MLLKASPRSGIILYRIIHREETVVSMLKTIYVVRIICPYFMLRPTKPSAWFITWPGTAGKDNPSGMSRLITGTPLLLKDMSGEWVPEDDRITS
jgi:hypothetical protein